MYKYSVVIPVYNRPHELDELLESLCRQTYNNFEVIVVEDGSTLKADQVVEKYRHQLQIRYYYKENTGQGFSRNFGYEKAEGTFFVVFDSDCIIPDNYFEVVDKYLEKHKLDAWGGPDRAHPSFTTLQKAISYSMTSLFTTGGIRGGKQRVTAFHPRSFNMGISRRVWDETKGYIITRMGEDIEFSLRIINKGFKTGLIEDAYVYHKRRTSLKQFYKQIHFFGRARINISRFFPKELKLVHAFPAVFVVGIILYLLTILIDIDLFLLLSVALAFYFTLIFIDSTIKNQSLKVGALSMITGFVQLWAYGVGFIGEYFKKLNKKKA